MALSLWHCALWRTRLHELIAYYFLLRHKRDSFGRITFLYIDSSMSYDRAQKLYLHLSPSAETEDDAAQAVKVTSNHITTTGLSS